LFEAAASGAAILSDAWSGLEDFYSPGAELFTARTAEEVLSALSASDGELHRVARAARERTLDQHTCHHRARTLLRYLEEAARPRRDALRDVGALWRHTPSFEHRRS
jgi:spore maturation protein CgeB